jgi:hypothetical protein
VLPHDRTANVNALCAGCHLGYVEKYPEKAYAEGWKVRRGLDPEGVPVAMWDGWFWLQNDGTRTKVDGSVHS